MRKLLLIIICCLCLCGCGNNFQASELKWEKSGTLHPLYYVVGDVKNNSTDDCQNLSIELSLKSGSLEEELSCPFYTIKSGETIKIRCQYSGNLSNITDYNVKVKNFHCMSF